MSARVIPDQSGGMLRWLITRAGQRNHIFNCHIAAWTAVTGAYVGSYTNGDTDVFDSAANIFAAIRGLYDASTSIEFAGAFPVASGTVQPLSNVDPASSPETVSGAGNNSTGPELGSQMTITGHDDGGNVVRYVFLDISVNEFTPTVKGVLIPQASAGSPTLALVDVLTGFATGPVFHTTPYQSHAGGVVQVPFTLVCTLNHRLRRDYGLI